MILRIPFRVVLGFWFSVLGMWCAACGATTPRTNRPPSTQADHQVRISRLLDARPADGWASAFALAKIGPAVLPALINALSSKKQSTRTIAVLTLFTMERQARSAASALTAVLKDESVGVRSLAASTLGRIGIERAKVSVPALVGALTDKDKAVRQSAAHSLGLFRAQAEPAVPALVRALEDKPVRGYVAQALCRICPCSFILGEIRENGRHVSYPHITFDQDRRTFTVISEARGYDGLPHVIEEGALSNRKVEWAVSVGFKYVYVAERSVKLTSRSKDGTRELIYY
jgi:hypothetical protein